MSYKVYDIDGNASDRFKFTHKIIGVLVTPDLQTVHTHTFEKDGFAIITVKHYYNNTCPKFTVCNIDGRPYTKYTVLEAIKYYDSDVSFVYRVTNGKTMTVQLAGHGRGENDCLIDIVEIEI